MKRDEAAWLAGLLEGEGCFDAMRARYPRIRVEMTDRDVVERVRSLVGTSASIQTPKRRPHHKPSFMLQIIGPSVPALLRQIRPWLGQRRGMKVDELLALQPRPVRRFGRRISSETARAMALSRWSKRHSGVAKR